MVTSSTCQVLAHTESLSSPAHLSADAPKHLTTLSENALAPKYLRLPLN